MKVIGKLKCVRYSVCEVMMIIPREVNAAEIKYSLWWPHAQWSHCHKAQVDTVIVPLVY